LGLTPLRTRIPPLTERCSEVRRHLTMGRWDLGRFRATVCSAALFALILSGCATPGANPIDVPGPIKSVASCPLRPEELIPAISIPQETLAPFLDCVSSYGSPETIQAAAWVRDWFAASACIHRCDNLSIDGIAHQSMLQGLRYIVVVSMGSNASETCIIAQRSLLTQLDESMNHVASWRALSLQQCTAQKKMELTEKRVAESRIRLSQLRDRISSFKLIR
jgi:hypothetical protein